MGQICLHVCFDLPPLASHQRTQFDFMRWAYTPNAPSLWAAPAGSENGAKAVIRRADPLASNQPFDLPHSPVTSNSAWLRFSNYDRSRTIGERYEQNSVLSAKKSSTANSAPAQPRLE